jgi:hypothetical protein
MGKVSKMMGAGLGSAVATVAVFFIQKYLPDVDAKTAEAITFSIYTLLTMGGAYAAPANQ